ncbi:hypothetical protein Glove_294g120 [Diversispora epigaea]|uniref:Ricin B lectin domain-containing protein n=1 Tax=Diversispora epigaea TaxID=1348612 RepID=A0A397I4A2_9GLOM|nr:hypothetical protein Glove_294g120 [Diversispora epigaea]
MVDNEKIPNKFVLSINGRELDFVTGIPYKISNKGNYIDDWGGGNGSCPSLSSENVSSNNSKFLRQLWVLKETSHSRGYKILGNKNYLDSWGGGHEAKLYLSSTDYPPETPCFLRQIWSFYSKNGSSKELQIHNEQNNCVLDTWGKGGGTYIFFCSHLNGPTSENYAKQLWKFIPAFDYKLNAVISNFKYKLSSDIKKQQITKNIREDTLDNLASSAKLTTSFNFQEELTNTYSFSFNESLDFISETKLITVIPFMNIEKEFNFKHSFEANKPTTTINKETCTITKTVEVPPKSCVKATDFADFVENIEIPFEATAEITATGDRYKKDGSIAKNTKVDSDAVKLFLKENNFKGKIIESEGYSVLAKVKGTLRGSYFIKTYRKLEDLPTKVNDKQEKKS